MLLKSCLPGYLNVLFILIVVIGQFDRLQCAALDPATPTNSVTKVIKKPPLHHRAASNSSAGSDLVVGRTPDLVIESSDKDTKPADHRSNATGALPEQPSKLTSEQAASTSSVAGVTSSPIHNSHKLDKSVELDRPELVKRAEKPDDAKQREAEESSLEKQLKAQKLSGPNEDSKLKRTKRRGRIGGKASSAGIGHGRMGAKQDSSNSTTTTNAPAFLLYVLVLLCSQLVYLKAPLN